MNETLDAPPDQPRGPRSTGRRRWRNRLVLAGGTLLTVLVAGLFWVQSDSGERWALGVVNAQLEQRLGFSLQAEDLELGLANGSVDLRRPRLVSRGDELLFEAERLRARAVLGSVLRRPVRLRELDVEAPRVHLGAEWGLARSEREAMDSTALPIVIDALRITEGEVLPPTLGEQFDGWVDELRVAGIGVTGSLDESQLSVDLVISSVVLAGAELGPPIDLALESRLSGETAGGLEVIRVDSLRLSGSGLELEADAELPLATPGSSSVSFDLDADAGLLAPRLSSSGRLEARGVASFADSALELELSAAAFPTRLLEPWLGADTFAKLPQRDASLDADVTALVTASTEPESEAAASSREVSLDLDGTLSWLSGSSTLLHATSIVDAAVDLSERQVRRFEVETRVESSELPIGVLRPWLGDEIARAVELADSTVKLDLTAQSSSASTERIGVDLDGAIRWSGHVSAPASTTASASPDLVAPPKTRRGRLLELQIDASHPAIVDRTAPARASWLNLAEDLDLDLGIESAGLPLWLIESLSGSESLGDLLSDDDLLVIAGELGYSDRLGIEGSSRWSWRRSSETMAEVVFDGRGKDESGALVLGAGASVLPGRLQSSDVTMELAAPLSDPQRARVRAGRIVLSALDVPATIAELEHVLPGIVPAGLAEQPLVAVLLDGTLDLASDFSGPVKDADVVLEVGLVPLDSVADGADVRGGWTLEASGKPFSRQGTARFESDGFELSKMSRLGRELAGRVAADVDVQLDGQEWSGEAQLRSDRLELADGRLLEELEVVLAGSVGRLELVRGHARFDESRVALVGEAVLPQVLELPIRLPAPAWLTVELERPMEGIDAVALRLGLDGSVLQIETTEVRSPAGTLDLAVRAPLGQLRALPALQGALDQLHPAHLEGDDGPVEIELELPEASLGEVFIASDESGLEDMSFSGLLVDLSLYLDDWSRSQGSLSAERAEVVLHPEGPVRSETLEARLAGGNLSFAVPRLTYRQEQLDVTATARIADPFAALRSPSGRSSEDAEDGNMSTAAIIESLRVRATGEFDAQLLNRWLAGGVATGVLAGELELEGPLDALRGRLRARGDEVTLTYLSPYETRIEAPDLDIVLENGSFLVSSAEGRLNEGPVFITGTAWGADGLDLEMEIGGARYRMDYGLSALLRGSARFVIPRDGRSRLTGDLTIIRGLIRRDIDLDRELRNLLLGLPELTGTDRGFAETVDLDLRLRTSSGVRVNNNLADLRVVWTPLDVRGTLAEPLVKGRLDVDPGGRFFAYGQVVQLDRGSIELSGLYGVPPKVDTVTTNSIQDPTLSRYARSDPFSLAGSSQELNREQVVEAGLLDYYGGRLTSTLERSLGGVRIDYDPLLFFGETEPEARLTVSQDLTQNVAVGVALNLRQAERRTYLLDLHDFAFAPGLSSQLFTNEERNQGATLQHSIQLRGSEVLEGPRVVEIKVPRVPHIDRGDLLDSLDLQEGDQLRDGGLFDLEVEIGDYLRGRGYPAPRVRARREDLETKRGRERARIDVAINAGSRAEIDFEGDRPSSRARRSIRALYRSDLFEESALQAMRDRTVTVLRGRGFFDPMVEITTERDVDEEGLEVDRVTVSSVGGRKVAIGVLEFPGLAEEEQSYLRSRFVGLAARIELALGAEAADRRLLSALGALGYPTSQVTTRELSQDGKRLRVIVEPGSLPADRAL